MLIPAPLSTRGIISTGAHGSGLMGRGNGVYEYVVGMRLVIPASPSEGYAKLISLTEADENELNASRLPASPSEGYAKLISLTEADENELNASRLSLGTLGVISQLTFALQPMFTRSLIAPIPTDDKALEKEAAPFLKAHEFRYLLWYPFHRLVVFLPVDHDYEVNDKFFPKQRTRNAVLQNPH